MYIESCQILFCIYWDDHMDFIILLVNVVYHIDWSADVEPSLQHFSIIYNNQDMGPSTDEWIKNIWCVIYIYTHNGILLRHSERWNLNIATIWMNFEGIMINNRYYYLSFFYYICLSQLEKDNHHMISLICRIWKTSKQKINEQTKWKQTRRQRTENSSSYQRGSDQGEGKMSKGTNCMVMDGN